MGNKMMYHTSKLADVIANKTGLNKISVWDALNELNYVPTELEEKDINYYASKVEGIIFSKNTLA
jgi:hypothetical protein